MQAYHLEEFGKPEGIVLRNRDEPKPGPNDVVIRVRAASLNRRDLMILARTYPLPAKLSPWATRFRGSRSATG